MSPTDTKRRLFTCFSWLGKKVTKMCFSKGGILWRFVMKICLIKHSAEVIQIQWQNFLHDPRINWKSTFSCKKWEKCQHFSTKIVPYLELSCAVLTLHSVYKSSWMITITKTYLYNFDPHKPHFYILKLGYTGVYISFLIFALKHTLWVRVRTALLRQF